MWLTDWLTEVRFVTVTKSRAIETGLYTVSTSGCVVLQYGGIVKTPNADRNEEYAYMHFGHGFCNVSGRAAAVECRQRYPHRIIPNRKTF